VTAQEVARLLVRIGAVEVRTDPAQWFTWSSGRRAPAYCDNRALLGFPEERARIADALAAAIRARFADADVIAGTATAGIPHAAWVAERLALPMVYVRGSAKEYGQGRRVEGRRLRGERVALLEDTISYGGSSLGAVEGLVAEGGKVLGVQSIFAWGFPETERRFAEAGVAWQSLCDFDALVATLPLTPEQARALREWRAS
jgi:orotate phosphoribosyltransferase